MMKIKFPVSLFIGLFFGVGIIFSLPATAKLYKWIDDKGTTHYDETIPPEYAGKNRAELNKAGRVIKQQEVLSPEELRANREGKEQEEAKKRAEEQAELEKKRRDKALTDTYSNSNEIDLARKRNLQQIEARINGINANLKMADDNLLGLQKEADAYTNANKTIPPSLQEDLQIAQARVDKLKIDLGKSQAEKDVMNARYDADKARYKELTGR
ncbi:MAG: DUF4124 domain-containing protein [Gallionella sp.]|nr:DUF4124 domain-containing protein [Gallionella sp.]